jgi:hypothetical protein
MERRSFLGAIVGALAMPSVPAATAPIAPALATDDTSVWLVVWGRDDVIGLLRQQNELLADIAWED